VAKVIVLFFSRSVVEDVLQKKNAFPSLKKGRAKKRKHGKTRD
jgi:hypothetical protein